jgi:alkylation response protein AidB-like acyl-CoA dehydrogenase
MAWLFNEEHRIFRKAVRNFVDESLNPHVDEWEKNGGFPKEVFKQLGDLGCLGIRFPAQYGGSEADMATTTVFCEEMGRCRSRGLTMGVLVQTDMSSPYLAEFGNDAQKEKYMPGIISGDVVCSVVLTEPDRGSDLANMSTTANRDGDEYVINGSKCYITNALNADLFFVAAKTNPEDGHRGVSVILVDRNTPGFTIEPMGKKLGMHGSDTGLLTFDNCRVPTENLLGEENKGFYYVMERLAIERYVAMAALNTSSQQALDDAIAYAQERDMFDTKLSQLQVTRHTLAKLQTKLEASYQLVYYACWLYDQGQVPTKEIAMCKAFTADVACEIADACLQIHGGNGYMEEYDIARFYRDARLWKIGAGSTETMYEIIAKQMKI